LMYINAEEYDSVIMIRKAYIGIKKKLLQYVYQQTEKLKNLMDSRVKLLKYVSNEGYNRGIRDTFTKCKKLEEEKEKLINENNILQKIIESSIPKNGRGFIKKNIEPIENKLIVNKSIIAEIPELIYTGSADDYVEENEIKIIFEQNKKKIRINISYKDCINLIKKKLSTVNNTNLLVSDIIFCCKIVFTVELKNATKKNIQIDDDENDDDEI
jgi:hypothetical protein